jgi:hypothetical protein
MKLIHSGLYIINTPASLALVKQLLWIDYIVPAYGNHNFTIDFPF